MGERPRPLPTEAVVPPLRERALQEQTPDLVLLSREDLDAGIHHVCAHLLRVPHVDLPQRLLPMLNALVELRLAVNLVDELAAESDQRLQRASEKE